MSSPPAKPLPSHEKRLRHQGKMLDEIMRHKREELSSRQHLMPITDLRALAVTAPDCADFAAALRQSGVSLIAEVKRASPSRGLLCRDFDPAELAQTYAAGGAAAISVLTDSRYFQGKLEDLTTVKEVMVYGASRVKRQGRQESPAGGAQREATSPLAGTPPRLPVLRKDFIFESYQVVEARVAGADALLLITAALSDTDLRRLLQETRAYGMQALVEVHDESEVERALDAGAQVIGVNNRDLRTFAVDLKTTERLRALIPSHCLVVSESGIHTPHDVRRLAGIGVDAMLVGESLVTANPKERLAKVRRLAQAGRL